MGPAAGTAPNVSAAALDRYCGPVQIAFSGSPRSSLGVEWELELVDRDTGELRSGASEILGRLAARRGSEHPKAKHELLESCVEVITGVCDSVARRSPTCTKRSPEVREEAGPLGLQLMCSGSHPTTDWSTQKISPNPRYHQLIDQMQWMARQMQIFGVHVHVGVRSGKKALSIVNALTAYIPHLLALSASSPYWIGTDTGLASYRSKVFEGLPTAGPRTCCRAGRSSRTLMETLIAAGSISSIREVWWDIRPHPDFGTVELRIFDGLPTLFGGGSGGGARASAWSRCSAPNSTGATPCRSHTTGSSGRTSGGPPATASTPRSSSTSTGEPSRYDSPSPTWSTSSARSPIVSVAPSSWPRPRGAGRRSELRTPAQGGRAARR